MKNDNKELAFRQNAKIAQARHDFTLTENKILMTLLYLADKYTASGEFSSEYGSISNTEGGKIITLPIKTILGNDFKPDDPSKNYKHIISAMESFSHKHISFRNDETEEWKAMPPFALIQKKAGSGDITVLIIDSVWRFITGIAGGYTSLRIDNILFMKSKYTVRMHQIVEGMIRPMTYKIETLKEMFMLEEKYSKTSHFLKKVLDVAKNELDELNLSSFNYNTKSIVKKRKKGVQPITHVVLIPQFQEVMDDHAVRRIVRSKGLTAIMTEEELTALLNIGFRPEEIQANAPAFYNFARFFNISMEIKFLKASAEGDNIENPKGYIISEIKRMVGFVQNEENNDTK